MRDWEKLQYTFEGIKREAHLWRVISWLRESFPINHVVFHSEHLPDATNYQPYLFLTYSKQWVEHYVSQNYVDIDPVVVESARTVLPLNWDKLNRQGRRVKRIFGEAKEHGVGPSGVTIPVHSPRGISSLVTYSSSSYGGEWSLFLDAHLGDLMTVSHLLHEKIQQIKSEPANLRSNNDVQRVTHMEERCLALASHGLTMLQISEQLRISERTVRTYLSSARYKLNAFNTTHAVSTLFRSKVWVS